MAGQTQFRGIQIAAEAITDTHIADAALSISKINATILEADGSQSLTADWDIGSFKIITTATPENAGDITTKAYVDAEVAAAVQGLFVKDAARVATASELNATYDNGTSGIGATLTNAGTQAAISIDGVSLSAGDLVLVKNQGDTTPGDALENGLYEVTTVGDDSTNWVLTRITPYDEASEINAQSYFYVREGTANGGTGWVQTESVTTMGTDNLLFKQFHGTAILTAGDGLTQSGNEFVVLADPSGTTPSLVVSASGVKINALGVTNAMLEGSIADSKLSQITTADKVAGSAVQLNSTGGIENSIGLKVKLDGSTLSLSAAGLKIADTFGLQEVFTNEGADPTISVSGDYSLSGSKAGHKKLIWANTNDTDAENVAFIGVQQAEEGVSATVLTAMVASAEGTGVVGVYDPDDNFTFLPMSLQSSDLKVEADVFRVTAADGASAFTPTADSHIATKKYVDDTVGGAVSAFDDLSDVTITTPVTGHIMVYSGGWVNVGMGGDATIDGTGSLSLDFQVISDAHIADSAAIAYSKLDLNGSIVNNDISASAAIVDSKLDTITTPNKVSGSAVQLANDGGLVNSSGLKVDFAKETLTPNETTDEVTLSSNAIIGSELVFLNGQLLDSGAGNDYQMTAETTVAFEYDVLSTDKVVVWYLKATA